MYGLQTGTYPVRLSRYQLIVCFPVTSLKLRKGTKRDKRTTLAVISVILDTPVQIVHPEPGLKGTADSQAGLMRVILSCCLAVVQQLPVVPLFSDGMPIILAVSLNAGGRMTIPRKIHQIPHTDTVGRAWNKWGQVKCHVVQYGIAKSNCSTPGEI